MELYVYSSEMELQGIVEKIASLIWTRRYWSCGEFKLLVPFTEEHSRMLVKNNIIMKRGDDEAAQIRYVSITKNSQGLEEIEVQGKFLIAWIGKRIIKKQIITNDTTQNILYRIVRENVTNPADTARKIPDVSIATDDEDTESGVIDYTSVHKRTACGRNGGKGGEAGNTNADGRANRRARLFRLRRARPYGGQYRRKCALYLFAGIR